MLTVEHSFQASKRFVGRGATLRHSPLTTRHSLFAIRYSLLTTRYSPLATRYSLLTTRHSPLTIRYDTLDNQHRHSDHF
jgi:hypothetical protein